DTPIETEKEEEKAMDKPMCPKGCGRPSPGLRGDGQPKICKECLSDQMRQIKKEQEATKPPYQKPKCKFPGCQESHFSRGFCHPHYDKWKAGKLPGDWPKWEPAKGKESVKPGQDIHENIPLQSGSEDSVVRENRTTETFLAKTAGLDVLTRLQEELEQKIREARRIHTAMMTIRDLYGVDFKIEALSLVG
ncbi:MAG: hypothetical protein PHV74_15915, partial [Dehalococcoidia bacterium]|nr:hypothetical protein [Dehalococcoidia bacterium]